MSGLVWAPGGDRIAYLRQAEGLGIISSQGIQTFDFSLNIHDKNYLAEHKHPYYTWYDSPRWSPSGQEIAFLTRAPGDLYNREERSLHCGTLKVFNTLTGDIQSVAVKVTCFTWTPALTYVEVRSDDTDYDIVFQERRVDLELRGLPSAFSRDGRVLLSRTYSRLGKDDPWWHARWEREDLGPDLVVYGLDLSWPKVLWERKIKYAKDAFFIPMPDYDWVDVVEEGKMIVVSTAGPKAVPDLCRPLFLLEDQRVSAFWRKNPKYGLPAGFPQILKQGILFISSEDSDQGSSLVFYHPENDRVEVLKKPGHIQEIAVSPSGQWLAVLEEPEENQEGGDLRYQLRVDRFKP